MTPEEQFERFERRVTQIGIIAAIFFVFCIIGLVMYFNRAEKLQENTNEIEQVQEKHASVLIQAQSDSYQLKEKAQSITNKIKSYEKPVIRDTTYAAMCEYVSGFTPTE